MFAPHTSGVPEDPATGSASGALGAYLIERGLVAAGSTVDTVSEQGTRMGRQSFIQIRIATSAGRITEILVGPRGSRDRRPPARSLSNMYARASALAMHAAQAPTPEMAVTPPSIRKSAPTTYAESSDAR